MGKGMTFNLHDVLLSGLAPDGGLFLPKSRFQSFSMDQLRRILGLDYFETAKVILERLIHPKDLSPQALSSMVSSAYSSFLTSEVVPLTGLKDNLYLAELFHGPSGSFK